MKTITLTFNEALVLIAEGMTMNNVKSLANKLRNADAPIAASDSNLQIAQAKAGTWEAAYHAAMVDLDKAKQTEITLRQQIQDLENEFKQDDESLKYFRQWVDTLRAALECDKGLTTSAVFSDAVSYVKEYKTTAELLKKTERNLEKANNVIAAVKLAYDHEGWTLHKAICEISDAVEAYYRGN